MHRYNKKTKKALGVLAFMIIVLSMIVFSVDGFSSGRYDRAKTGCECHGSSADPSVTVDLTGHPAEYEPLQLYQLTVTVSGGPAPSSTKGGFNLEVSAGGLSSGDSNVQTSSLQATHTNPNQRSWTVDWTSPAKGTGNVTIWIAGNAVNGNGKTGGDGWNLFSTVVSEVISQEFSTVLKPGWNLISIPLIQEDQDIAKVLEPIDGDYDAVQWYDVTDLSDPWKHSKVGKHFGNDLSQISEKMGLWISITQPGDTIFVFNGTEPTENQTIALHTGWNLVGYPSLTNRVRDDGLNNINFNSEVDMIQTFNSTTGLWEDMGPSDYFVMGRGYWIHSLVDEVWTVPL